MSEIRTELPSGEHIRVIGEGRAVLDYWPNIKPYYADILAGPRVQGTTVVWDLGARYVGEADAGAVQAARERLAQANARVDPVLETLAQIRQRRPSGRYYVCSDEEYRRIEQLMPRLPAAPAAAEAQKHIPAASLETLFSLLEEIRGSLDPGELDPKQVVRTSEGPRIIGWGLVVFTPVRIIAPPPSDDSQAVAVAAGPVEGEKVRRKRRLWPLLLLLLLLLPMAALMLYLLRTPPLPFDEHDALMATDELELPVFANISKFAMEICKAQHGDPGEAVVVETATTGPAYGTNILPEVRPGRGDPWKVGPVDLANVQGLREGFRIEAQMAKSDRWLRPPPKWTLGADPPEQIYCRQDGPDANDRVGVDLYLPPAGKRGVRGTFSRGGSFDVQPGTGEVLFRVSGEDVRSYYWIGVELDRPVRPTGLRMRVIEPTGDDWPEGWRKVKRPVTLIRGDGKDRRYFYIFLLMPADTIETYGDKIVKIELSGADGSKRNLIARVVRTPGDE